MPHHVRRGDVASPAWADGRIWAAAVPARKIDHAVVMHRHRDGKPVGFVEVPEWLARCRSICLDALARIHDELFALGAWHNDRSAVREHPFGTVAFPQLLPRAGVER